MMTLDRDSNIFLEKYSCEYDNLILELAQMVYEKIAFPFMMMIWRIDTTFQKYVCISREMSFHDEAVWNCPILQKKVHNVDTMTHDRRRLISYENVS